MAPSPTGPLHIGSARTALFNWLFARQHNGVFVLRIEDTDKARSEKKYDEEILAGFKWLGLDWDEGPYRQSERTEFYKKYLEELLKKGDAYYCYCTKSELESGRKALEAKNLPPKYSGRCRELREAPRGMSPEAIRFKVQEVVVEFVDMIRGKVSFDASLFGDIVIAKDLETAFYNFAVVVDDELMKISHVIRGEDHISNTPKQILIQRALGFQEPIYAHIPLILNADRSKMSKRLNDTALSQYREKGYLPEGLLNFLALLGWHPKDDREVLGKKELIAEFDLARVQHAGAVFNQEKLDWVDREHLKLLDDDKIAVMLAPFLEAEKLTADKAFLEKLVHVERSRASTLRDFIDGGRFLFQLPEYEPALLVWKDTSVGEALGALTSVLKAIDGLSSDGFDRETVSKTIMQVIGEQKRGVILWPLRVALSGKKASPDPIDIMTVLGKTESIRRIEVGIQKLKQ